jgi:hypothetical protein
MGQKTKTCVCQRRKYFHPQAGLIGARYDAALRRCTNPLDPAYHNYGLLGIEMRFPSRETYVKYVLEFLPCNDYSAFEIDRPNGSGHYEPGNLQLVTKAENLRNKWTNKRLIYNGENIVAADLWARLKADHPAFSLSKGYTAKLAAKGEPVADILERGTKKK